MEVRWTANAFAHANAKMAIAKIANVTVNALKTQLNSLMGNMFVNVSAIALMAATIS